MSTSYKLLHLVLLSFVMFSIAGFALAQETTNEASLRAAIEADPNEGAQDETEEIRANVPIEYIEPEVEQREVAIPTLENSIEVKKAPDTQAGNTEVPDVTPGTPEQNETKMGNTEQNPIVPLLVALAFLEFIFIVILATLLHRSKKSDQTTANIDDPNMQ